MRIKIILTALAATLLLAFAVGTASALRSISLNNTRTEVTTNALTFKGVNEGFGVICRVTFLRTLSAAFPKTQGILIGTLTGVRIDNNCRDTFGFAATVTVRTEPRSARCGARSELCVVAWRLFYNTFLGTLPRITGFNGWIEGTNFLIEDTLSGKECEYGGQGWLRTNVVEATGAVRSGEALPEKTQALTATLAGTCEPRGEFRGTSNAPNPGITIRLI